MTGFLGDIPDQIRMLDEMLDTNDIRGTALRAHTIRGASANVSGESMRVTALHIEEAATAGNLEVARAQMNDLRAAFDRIQLAATETYGRPTGGEE